MVQQNVSDGLQPVIIGAGPAGLTAAVEFLDHGVKSRVFEADSIVGGISRTVESNGWRFDIGGHRFFTKVPRVEKFWHRVLPDGDFGHLLNRLGNSEPLARQQNSRKSA